MFRPYFVEFFSDDARDDAILTTCEGKAKLRLKTFWKRNRNLNLFVQIVNNFILSDSDTRFLMSSAQLDKTKRVGRWYFGGVASAMAACVTHPLDLLKVINF